MLLRRNYTKSRESNPWFYQYLMYYLFTLRYLWCLNNIAKKHEFYPPDEPIFFFIREDDKYCMLDFWLSRAIF